MSITTLFATPLWNKHVNNIELLEEIRVLINDFYKGVKEAGTVSEDFQQTYITENKIRMNQKGVTSFYSDDFATNSKWKSVRDQLLIEIKSLIEPQADTEELDFFRLWATIYPKNAHIPLHCHQNAALSGVFYIDTHEEGGDITFQDPAWLAKIMYAGRDQPQTRYTVSPTDGLLLVFPSWLPHQSTPNLSDKNRLIISFNLTRKSDPKMAEFDLLD